MIIETESTCDVCDKNGVVVEFDSNNDMIRICLSCLTKGVELFKEEKENRPKVAQLEMFTDQWERC